MTEQYNLDQLRSLFSDLIATLEQERQALTRHDGVALDECVAQKHALCKTIETNVRAAPQLAALLQSATNSETQDNQCPDLDADHTSLLELVIAARDSNLVNGKILHRSQQSLREILGILSGKSLDGLYGQSGQQTPTGPGNSAIARA